MIKKKSTIHRTNHLLALLKVLFPPIILRVDYSLTIAGRDIDRHEVAKFVADWHKIVSGARLSMINRGHVGEKVFATRISDIVSRLGVEKSLHTGRYFSFFAVDHAIRKNCLDIARHGGFLITSNFFFTHDGKLG